MIPAHYVLLILHFFIKGFVLVRVDSGVELANSGKLEMSITPEPSLSLGFGIISSMASRQVYNGISKGSSKLIGSNSILIKNQIKNCSSILYQQKF
jgi:hypothetical protein